MYLVKRQASRYARAPQRADGADNVSARPTAQSREIQDVSVAIEDGIAGPGVQSCSAASGDETSSEPTQTKKEQGRHTIGQQLRAILLKNWLNLLLVFVPVGIASALAGLSPVIVFVVNFIAIIPLAGLLSYATEELSLRVGEVVGGLLNASFGNAVELIVSIIALVKKEILIVQTSLIGSILSNLLLVLGMAFTAGGFNRIEQEFNTTVAQASSGLLFFAVGSLIIPTLFHQASAANDNGIVQLSRASAVILLLVYASYLFFQLKSHKKMFSEPSAKNEKRSIRPNRFRASTEGDQHAESSDVDRSAVGAESAPQNEGATAEVPEIPVVTAVLVLLISTALVAVCAEFLVSSINSLVLTAGISRVFVGLILLPIVGNAAEHYTAVTVAVKDKMDLSVSVAVGSSLQIALLVIPLVVVLGWCLGIDEMTLYFDEFQIGVMFLSVLLVNYLVQDGKSNYLEGNLLMAVYLIISVAAWFYPQSTSM